MALIRTRARPTSAADNNAFTAVNAGSRPFSHSRIGQESRTRVFKRPLPLLKCSIGFDQIDALDGASQLSPARLFGQYDTMSLHIERELRSLTQIERFADRLRNCDLTF